MVWGMSLPSGFGEFWPEGSFEGEIDGGPADGWGQRLKAFYLEQTFEAQKILFDHVDDGLGNAAHSYPYYVSQKFIKESGTSENRHRPPLNSIKDHEPPRFFDVVRGAKTLSSLIMLNDRILAVDEVLKAIIERLEPGVHQFFPLEMRYRGRPLSTSYYTLVIGLYLDSFLPELSDPESWCPNGSDEYFHTKTKKGISGLTVQSSIVGNAKLWRERRMSFLPIFFSDGLHDEIAKSGIRIPKHYHMKGV